MKKLLPIISRTTCFCLKQYFTKQKMDEKEVLLAMNRIRLIEAEARKRLLKEKEEKQQKKPKPKAPKKACKAKTTTGASCTRPALDGKDICKQHSSPPKPEKVVKPAVVKKESKKKKEPIPAAIKTLVWNKWVGEKQAEAGCFCCRVTTISMRHFHCGHVVSEKRGGGMTIDNLRPVCANCNLSMGTMDMREFIEKFGLHK